MGFYKMEKDKEIYLFKEKKEEYGLERTSLYHGILNVQGCSLQE